MKGCCQQVPLGCLSFWIRIYLQFCAYFSYNLHCSMLITPQFSHRNSLNAILFLLLSSLPSEGRKAFRTVARWIQNPELIQNKSRIKTPFQYAFMPLCLGFRIIRVLGQSRSAWGLALLWFVGRIGSCFSGPSLFIPSSILQMAKRDQKASHFISLDYREYCPAGKMFSFLNLQKCLVIIPFSPGCLFNWKLSYQGSWVDPGNPLQTSLVILSYSWAFTSLFLEFPQMSADKWGKPSFPADSFPVVFLCQKLCRTWPYMMQLF